ncbi:DsbC family protein [Litorivicinus sp.]|nr:DsbC family protein [Litorivicinus sp.]MDC1208418.1 DsbC family protein [Litorivicinus sp.]MDC1466624.1 DsbC family protein [Litorivicinus sp.]
MRWFIILFVLLSRSVLGGEAQIREAIIGINQSIQIQSIQLVENSPFFEVRLVSGERLYADSKGTYFVAGNLYEIGEIGFINLTDIGRRSDRKRLSGELNDQDLVIFTPEDEVKYRLLVFTDIDCGYCRKLHSEIDSLLDQGVEVRYAAFPRAGLQSDSYRKYVSVICSQDRKNAMTRAKQGENIPDESCENSVGDQFNLGQRLGITGTPTLIFENGDMQPGYMPWKELLKRMNQSGS